MQILRCVRFLVALLVLPACTESTEERVNRLLDQADKQCWAYHCLDGPEFGTGHRGPSTDEGVACMNDALASGELAVTSWGIDHFNPWSTDYTYQFTIDHEVHIFTSFANGPEAPTDYREVQTCSGPFRAGPTVCGYLDSSAPNGWVDIVAPTGCP